MAIATLTEFAPTADRGTTNYDAISAALAIDRDPPEGLVVHTAGFSDDGTFRIFNVWDSPEHANRFTQRLMPVVQEVAAAAGGPPRSHIAYPLHGLTVLPARAAG